MSNSVSLIDGHIDEDSIIEKTGKCGSITPPCKTVRLPCNLKDEITLLNGEKRTVEYLVYDGEWHFGTENGEFNEREIINLPIEEKTLKEPVPKASAHNSFFYNRFMKTV